MYFDLCRLLSSLLKSLNAQKRLLLLINIAFIISALLITTNCGKRKPPLPPLERIAQRVEITGTQRGNKVIISWTMPARNASDNNTLNVSRADIYRLTEPLDTSLTLTEEEFASNSTLISTVPIADSDFGLNRMSFSDELEFSNQLVRLRYAIRFVNAQGQKAAFSNFLIVEPVSKISKAPGSLSVDLTEKSIILRWISPTSNVDGSKPANILGFNIYRGSPANETIKQINTKPVLGVEFLDSQFAFDNKYFYFVRAVSLGNNGEPVESLDSNIVEILPKDIFAPSAPTAITIAAAPGTLSLFFAVNPEKDIDGYRIYRSTEPNSPKSDWQLITSNTLKTNTFQDKQVESGKTYYYYIISIDTAGNVSQPSDVVSETAP